MDDSSLLTGHKSFEPESMKLIVLSESTSNPLRPAPKSRIAMRVTEDITWLRELNAAITYIHGGRILKQESLHSDYYGFLTAANDLFSDVDDRMETYGVTRDSSLEITIRMGIVDVPTLGFAKEGWGGRKLYTPINGPVWLADGIPDDADFFSIPWDERVTLGSVTHTVADVWSSKRSREENDAILAEYRKTANADTRIVGRISDVDDQIEE